MFNQLFWYVVINAVLNALYIFVMFYKKEYEDDVERVAYIVTGVIGFFITVVLILGAIFPPFLIYAASFNVVMLVNTMLAALYLRTLKFSHVLGLANLMYGIYLVHQYFT